MTYNILMRLNLTSLIIVSTGAFFYWTLSGYKGSFDEHMSRYYDNDNKYDKNYWAGLLLITFIVMTILGIVYN